MLKDKESQGEKRVALIIGNNNSPFMIIILLFSWSAYTIYRCGTNWSGWLMTAHPSVEDGKVHEKVCYSARSADSNCVEKWSIFVKNCGLYYIYELLAPNACPMRFCGTGEK